MEKLSIESIEGDNYLPLHGRNYQPKPSVRQKEPEIHLPQEWDDAVNEANEKDLQELAGMFRHIIRCVPEVNIALTNRESNLKYS